MVLDRDSARSPALVALGGRSYYGFGLRLETAMMDYSSSEAALRCVSGMLSCWATLLMDSILNVLCTFVFAPLVLVYVGGARDQ